MLLHKDPKDRPTAYEVLKFYIPLVYKNLGKLNGYEYYDKSEGEKILKEAENGYAGNVNLSLNEYLNASTATMNDYYAPRERSILYHLKSFANNFSLDPVPLPSTMIFRRVASSGSHFLVVTEGKYLDKSIFFEVHL